MKKIFFTLILLLMILLGLFVLRVPIAQSYAEFFYVHDAEPGADALLVLAGSYYVRLPFAIDLYRKKYAPLILFTEEKEAVLDPRLGKIYLSNMEKIHFILQKLDFEGSVKTIPSLKGGATSTFDEAYDFKSYLIDHPIKRIILVTEDYHTRRAQMAFKTILPKDIVVQVAGIQHYFVNAKEWWKTDVGIQIYIAEGMKFLYYLFSDHNSKVVENH